MTQQHGGTIAVDSRVGEFTEFTIRLPRAHRDSRRGSIMSVSILVVDDEPDVAELFRQRFRRETRQGTYVMHFAASGAEAFDRLCRRNRADADRGPLRHQHARHGRAAIVGEIKQRFPDLPVMMVTAYGDDERRRRAADMARREFITKPVDFDFLKSSCASCPACRIEERVLERSNQEIAVIS